jgi:hypothetical protein
MSSAIDAQGKGSYRLRHGNINHDTKKCQLTGVGDRFE